ncbi:MAG: hypothetical protein HYY17_03250 [Planctomycetes bacterium]|nr:hypothetical protein [Planctomycetota bacterium]
MRVPTELMPQSSAAAPPLQSGSSAATSGVDEDQLQFLDDPSAPPKIRHDHLQIRVGRSGNSCSWGPSPLRLAHLPEGCTPELDIEYKGTHHRFRLLVDRVQRKTITLPIRSGK